MATPTPDGPRVDDHVDGHASAPDIPDAATTGDPDVEPIPRFDLEPKNRKPLLIKAGVVVAALLAVAVTVALSSRPTALEAAHEACGLAFASPEDDGKTLVLDMKGEDDLLGEEMADIACVLDDLDIPTSVISLMDSTRALDGRQTADWDGITATWGYHPHSGLDIILTED